MRDEMDALVGATARVSDADVEELPLRSAETELMEEIMSTPVLETVAGAEPPGRQPRRWVTGRRLAAVAGIAAVATAAAFTVQTNTDSGSVWASEVMKVAESVPRLIVDHPDWQITDAEQFTLNEGTMTVSDGTYQLHVGWASEWDYASKVENLQSVYEEERSLAVAGHEAVLLFSPETGDGTVLWQQGDYVVEVLTLTVLNDGQEIDASTLEDVVGSFTQVDVDTWLDAMPDDVVQPDDVEAAVEEMLADIPTPDGFDPTDLAESAGVRDQYHLGADVTGAVACGWIGQWTEATDSGDDSAASEAEEALGSSYDWPILKTMEPEGDFPYVVWGYADALANDGVMLDGTRVDRITPAGEMVGDTVLEEPVQVYREALGCDD
ncbi:hypothetical protein [Phytoactinopolyspora endophytica]|uniref:hypothetical protein n=1 Tax=Phytoactinopolyspora endophytica TaxID=1642495 RepID=UPI00101C9FDB|nr:hypothetical protein [Phytoactinopolyspora endophytica]